MSFSEQDAVEHSVNASVMPLTNAWPAVLTVREAAKVMRIGQNRMYEVVRREGFPAIREGWKFLIPRDAFLRWLEEQAK